MKLQPIVVKVVPQKVVILVTEVPQREVFKTLNPTKTEAGK